MSKSRIIKRLVLSIAGGMWATVGVFLLVVLTDSGDSMLPLLERHPFAVVFVWPELLLSVESLEVAVVGNMLLYWTLLYLLQHWSDKSTKLP